MVTTLLQIIMTSWVLARGELIIELSSLDRKAVKCVNMGTYEV